MEKYLVDFDEAILCAISALGDWYICLSKFLFEFDSIEFMRLLNFLVEILNVKLAEDQFG
jgi:hypothetical protein